MDSEVRYWKVVSSVRPESAPFDRSYNACVLIAHLERLPGVCSPNSWARKRNLEMKNGSRGKTSWHCLIVFLAAMWA